MMQRNKPSRKATYRFSAKANVQEADSFPNFNWNYYTEEKPVNTCQRRNRAFGRNSNHQVNVETDSDGKLSRGSHFDFVVTKGQSSLFLELHLKFRDDIVKFVYD